jgi:hypothetical protein
MLSDDAGLYGAEFLHGMFTSAFILIPPTTGRSRDWGAESACGDYDGIHSLLG